MGSFISDCRFVAKMIRARVTDEDDTPLTLWQKLGVAVEILCGMITIEHEAKGRD